MITPPIRTDPERRSPVSPTTVVFFPDPPVSHPNPAGYSGAGEPIEGHPNAESGNLRQNPLAPEFALTSDKTRISESYPDKRGAVMRGPENGGTPDVSSYVVKRKDSLTVAVNESAKWTILDSNQRPPRCQRESESRWFSNIPCFAVCR